MKYLDDLLSPYKQLPKSIWIIFFSRMINALGMFIFPLFTLILNQKIGLSQTETGFWIMMIGFVFIPSNMIGGKIADVYGRKKPIVIFEGIGALLYIICGFMPPGIGQVYVIIAACFFFGLAEPANNAIMADLTNPDNRAGAFSLSYMGFNLGFAVGPFLGGILFDKDLYHWIFWGDAFTLLLSILLIAIFIPETFGTHTEVISEDRVMEQSVEGSTLKILIERPILLWFSLILLAYNFAYAQWSYLLPLHTFKIFEDGAAFYGLLASLNGIIVILFTPLVTKLVEKRSDLNKNFIGGLLYMIGFGAFAFIDGKLAFALACFVFTIGEIVVTISFMPFLANRTPASHRGRINAVMPIIMGIGRSVGPLAMGIIIENSSIEKGWMVVGAVMAAGVIFMKILEVWEDRNVKTS